MPGGDRTGPTGMVPMTGRRAGYCAGHPLPGYANPVGGRGHGFGFGRRWGRDWGCGGFGRGMGRGFRRGFGGFYGPYADPDYGNPAAPEMSPKQEVEMLKEQAKAMQDELNAVNERIREMESAPTSCQSGKRKVRWR